ncbi:proteasome activator complex subunit 3-like [Oppia nitens]|uniref:proteasome activator complex subunit 3-like n=1 Tax=Oppia nitens TaxID=1686743 RepID=UPI0023DC5050|nr:proteasome activator complex subunit 3-like [Oppia nitens]
MPKNKKQKVCAKIEKSEYCVDSYKEKTKNKSEFLVLDEFPQRILQIQHLLSEDEFNLKTIFSHKTDVNIPVPDKPISLVKSNQLIQKLVALLKPKALQLINDANLVKMGISLMIPKIEDGNNFGVAIQQEILLVVAIVELKTEQQLEQFVEYYRKRAELVAKVAKYPHIIDYRNAVQELDRKFHLYLCLLAVDLRNHYISLHDLFIKNLNKIRNPRNSDDHQIVC